MTDRREAFPGPIDAHSDGTPVWPTYPNGMEMRDYFAAKAMQALVASVDWVPGGREDEYVDSTAGFAYQIADGMMSRREKQGGT